MKTNIPPHLTARVMEYAEVELAPRSTLIQFYLTMALGALVTLLFCPQFGIGPLGGGHGITHWVMSLGPWVCGAFCGAVFLGAGALAALAFLSPAQWRWVLRQQLWLFYPATVGFFALFMTVKLTAGLSGMHDGPAFYFAWNLFGVMTSWFVLRLIKQFKTA